MYLQPHPLLSALFEAFLSCVVLGAEDFTPEQDVEEVRQIEKQIKRRFAIGTQVRTKNVATFCSVKINLLLQDPNE